MSDPYCLNVAALFRRLTTIYLSLPMCACACVRACVCVCFCLSSCFSLSRRCIYFLDPDDIVPPSVAIPPAPMPARTRTNSLSKPELEPVILEPPVTTNPLLTRPTLPQADISTIRRLSARVNVLPVIARADALTNDRLAAVKFAVRRDLAAAGIGFGIFDSEMSGQYAYAPDAPDIIVPRLNVPGEQALFEGCFPRGRSACSG